MSSRLLGKKKPNIKDITRPGLSTEDIVELHNAFCLFDEDGGGTIDANELKQAMSNMGFNRHNKMVRFILDDMKDEEIDFEGFLDLMTARIDERNAQEDIIRVFSLFDVHDTGVITFKDLQRVCSELGESISDRELTEMLEKADQDGDGVVNKQEFINIMTKQTLL